MNIVRTKALLLITALLCGLSSYAQFETAYIGVNGMTCSQCTRTVEMSIRKLDFVADVQMNLQHTEGKIILKKNKITNMEQLALAVTNAGFSVRYLQAELSLQTPMELQGNCWNYKGDQYVFAKPVPTQLSGIAKLTFIGKKYMPKNEFKKIGANLSEQCSHAAGNVYHVSLSRL